MTKKIETFEQYCVRKGISAEIPDMSGFPEELHKFLTAQFKLLAVCKSENGEWKADWTNHQQRKWYPWFIIERNEDNLAGVAARYSSYDLGDAYSGSVSRLCLETKEKCDFVRDNFTDLWIDFLNG
jgi:hypothetical protein